MISTVVMRQDAANSFCCHFSSDELNCRDHTFHKVPMKNIVRACWIKTSLWYFEGKGKTLAKRICRYYVKYQFYLVRR
jgi:hypothetical protein